MTPHVSMPALVSRTSPHVNARRPWQGDAMPRKPLPEELEEERRALLGALPGALRAAGLPLVIPNLRATMAGRRPPSTSSSNSFESVGAPKSGLPNPPTSLLDGGGLGGCSTNQLLDRPGDRRRKEVRTRSNHACLALPCARTDCCVSVLTQAAAGHRLRRRRWLQVRARRSRWRLRSSR